MNRSAASNLAALLAVGVFVTALACSTPKPSDQPGTAIGVGDQDRLAQQRPTSGLVVRVLDGVTIEVESEGATFRVRYLGVAIPDEAGREAALEFNRFLVEGRTVRIFDDASDADVDGIPLRYVYSDGEMVNLKLLAAGWARLAEFPPSFDHLDEFSQAENSARSDGRGVWKSTASNDPVGNDPDGSVPDGHDPETAGSDGERPTATPPPVTSGAPAFTGGTLPAPPGSFNSAQCDYSGTSEPVIKGNIDQRTGEREYHIPGGLYYTTTVIEPSEGEIWFCTEVEALSQGWNRSKY